MMTILCVHKLVRSDDERGSRTSYPHCNDCRRNPLPHDILATSSKALHEIRFATPITCEPWCFFGKDLPWKSKDSRLASKREAKE